MNKLLGEQIQRGLGGTLRGGWRLCSEPSTSCSYHKFVSAHATGMSHTVVGNTNLISPTFSMTKPVFIYSHSQCVIFFSIIGEGIISVFENLIGFQNQGETSSRWGKERSRVAGMCHCAKDFKRIFTKSAKDSKKKIMIYGLNKLLTAGVERVCERYQRNPRRFQHKGFTFTFLTISSVYALAFTFYDYKHLD